MQYYCNSEEIENCLKIFLIYPHARNQDTLKVCQRRIFNCRGKCSF